MRYLLLAAAVLLIPACGDSEDTSMVNKSS